MTPRPLARPAQPLDLEAIRTRLEEFDRAPVDEKSYTAYAKHGRMLADIRALVAEVERLRRAQSTPVATARDEEA